MLWLILGCALIWLLLSLVVALALGHTVAMADTADEDARVARQIKQQFVDARTVQLESVIPARRAG